MEPKELVGKSSQSQGNTRDVGVKFSGSFYTDTALGSLSNILTLLQVIFTMFIRIHYVLCHVHSFVACVCPCCLRLCLFFILLHSFTWPRLQYPGDKTFPSLSKKRKARLDPHHTFEGKIKLKSCMCHWMSSGYAASILFGKLSSIDRLCTQLHIQRLNWTTSSQCKIGSEAPNIARLCLGFLTCHVFLLCFPRRWYSRIALFLGAYRMFRIDKFIQTPGLEIQNIRCTIANLATSSTSKHD